MDDYDQDNRFKYIFVDGHTFSNLPNARVRSNIFPGPNGTITPYIFYENPKAKTT